MNRSIKKIINKRLRKLVGHEIIRIGPTEPSYDSAYTEQPVILEGFTKSGKMIVKYPRRLNCLFGSSQQILSTEFTDRKWRLYSRVFKKGNSKLNRWSGKKIRRINPVCFLSGYKCTMFINEPVALISASKSYLVIKVENEFLQLSQIRILRWEYANPRDWELAE